jgi:uncharacterized HAD superfamily protein
LKVYGFDIDGVISNIAWFVPSRILQIVFHFIFEVKFFWKLYNQYFRKVNGKIYRVMAEVKKRGHKIIIVSGNPEWRRPEIEEWLERKNVPYDKLFLAPAGTTNVAGWKRDTLEKENCLYFLDDVVDVVACINRAEKCRAIWYQRQLAKEILKILFS